MTEDTLEAPNWLTELEKKREIRLKVRLGHETGAGAPCLVCSDKCPGLDLHFWRKICKNCKCSKEDHDVADDDIYGWAQFQLLGNKPNNTRKKIVLPGRKDEVELEWIPKGHTETIDKYLKTLPPESLPVKGSQAAQNRKQLLQKQIPIHDVDPTLCHELTEQELKRMHDYIENMKKNSVGVGQVIQLAIHRSGLHVNENPNASLVSSRFPKIVPGVETVKLQAENVVGALPKQFSNLDINKPLTSQEILEQKELDAFFDKIPNPANMSAYSEIKPLKQVPSYPEVNQNGELLAHLPAYAAGNLNIISNYQKPVAPGNIRDLAFSTYDLTNSNLSPSGKSLTSYHPLTHEVSENQTAPNQVNIGAIRDICYDDLDVKSAKFAKTPDLLNNFENETLVENVNENKTCHKCLKSFKPDEFAIFVERSNSYYHPACFKCNGCNQSLADMLYFYDKDSDNIYCGRDFAKIRGIPRCKACDELIFVKEYCLAEDSTFHVKHFCCFECDTALAGQNYVIEDSQPVCLPCFEKVKANKCEACFRIIKPDEQGANLNGVHFHASDECFACRVCKKGLLGAKLLFRNRRLYCSHACFGSDT